MDHVSQNDVDMGIKTRTRPHPGCLVEFDERMIHDFLWTTVKDKTTEKMISIL
jgi:hypothetical protein